MLRRSGMLWGVLCLLGVSLLTGSGRAQTQRMAIPSYFYPGALWKKVEASTPTVGIVIINPNSGPGTQRDPNYVAQVAELKTHHIVVLGYVHTSYTKRNFAEVQAEVESYVHWYGVGGIFYDEVSNTKPEIPYYQRCQTLARSLIPKGLVVLNPGAQTDEGYMAVCDILVNFESPFNAYQKQYSAPSWVSHYPARRFWHIVLQVPTDADMRTVIHESKQRNAGWMFVTLYGDPNPYDKLPEDPYWSDELAALSATKN